MIGNQVHCVVSFVANICSIKYTSFFVRVPFFPMYDFALENVTEFQLLAIQSSSKSGNNGFFIDSLFIRGIEIGLPKRKYKRKKQRLDTTHAIEH